MNKVGWGERTSGAYGDKILVRGADQRGDVWAIWCLVLVMGDSDFVAGVDDLGVYRVMGGQVEDLRRGGEGRCDGKC